MKYRSITENNFMKRLLSTSSNSLKNENNKELDETDKYITDSNVNDMLKTYQAIDETYKDKLEYINNNNIVNAITFFLFLCNDSEQKYFKKFSYDTNLGKYLGESTTTNFDDLSFIKISIDFVDIEKAKKHFKKVNKQKLNNYDYLSLNNFYKTISLYKHLKDGVITYEITTNNLFVSNSNNYFEDHVSKIDKSIFDTCLENYLNREFEFISTSPAIDEFKIYNKEFYDKTSKDIVEKKKTNKILRYDEI